MPQAASGLEGGHESPEDGGVKAGNASQDDCVQGLSEWGWEDLVQSLSRQGECGVQGEGCRHEIGDDGGSDAINHQAARCCVGVEQASPCGAAGIHNCTSHALAALQLKQDISNLQMHSPVKGSNLLTLLAKEMAKKGVYARWKWHVPPNAPGLIPTLHQHAWQGSWPGFC